MKFADVMISESESVDRVKERLYYLFSQIDNDFTSAVENTKYNVDVSSRFDSLYQKCLDEGLLQSGTLEKRLIPVLEVMCEDLRVNNKLKIGVHLTSSDAWVYSIIVAYIK